MYILADFFFCLKKISYLCIQVLADRCDATLLRQDILSLSGGAGMIFEVKTLQH